MISNFNKYILLTTIAICLYGGNLFAQGDTNLGYFSSIGRSIVVGETDTVGEYRISMANCEITGSTLTRSRLFWWGEPAPTTKSSGYILFTPKDTGTFIDTAVFLYGTKYVSGVCFGSNGYSKIIASVKVRNDSLVRVLPHYLQATMSADTQSKLWKGSIDITLDNNVKQNTLFRDFAIVGDTTNLKFEVTNANNDISEYTSSPNERSTQLHINFSLNKGPIFADTLKRVILRVQANTNGKDTVFNVLVDITLKAAQYTFSAKVLPDNIDFNTTVGSEDVKNIVLNPDPKTTKYVLTAISHPFSVKEIRDSLNMKILTISCIPRSGGFYKDRLIIYCYGKDFFDSVRIDSLYLNITAEISSDSDSNQWQQLSYPDTAARSLVVRNDSVLVAGNKLLFTSDNGFIWESYDSLGSGYSLLLARNGNVISFPNRISTNYGGKWYSVYGVGEPQPSTSYYEYVFGISLKKNGEKMASCMWSNYYKGVQVSGGSGLRIFSESENKWRNYGDWRDTSYLMMDSNDRVVAVSGMKIHIDSMSNSQFTEQILCSATSRSNYFVAIKNNGVFVSHDTGRSWRKTGLIFPDVRSICVINDREVYISSWQHGIYYSSDTGSNWYGVSAGLATMNIHSIAYDPGRYLYLGTDKSGIYKTKNAIPLSIPTKPVYTIAQTIISVTENPSLGAASFKFTVADQSNVHIIIFDALGRVVKDYDLGVMTIGDHELPFNLEYLPSGSYIAEIREYGSSGRCKFVIM